MAEQMQGVLPASAIQSSVSPELAVMAPAPVNPSATPAAENIQPPASAPPEQVSETLYIQNLNERVKLDGKTSLDNSHTACELTEMILITVMKQTLRSLFKNYGEVLDVVAHSNLRMRGQAFVSFADKDIAKKAQREVNRFPLYSKPMVCPFPSLPEEHDFDRTHITANIIRQKSVRRGGEEVGCRAF